MRVARVATLALCLLLATSSNGFAAKKAPKSKKAKAAKGPAAKPGGGFGAATAAGAKKAGPTAAQLLKASMEQYEALETLKGQLNKKEAEEEYGENAGDDSSDEELSSVEKEASTSVTKWVVTLRSTGAGSVEFSDWVPVAILALACGADDDPASLVPTALGACVREVVEGTCQAQPAMRKVGRETVEYAHEPLDSFETHVYDGLSGRGERRAEASRTLGLEGGASAGEVKKAHRKLMMELHPDRFVGDEEGAKAAQERMLEVQDAYAELGGGTGGSSGSFYASIGGKARVSFSGPLPKEALAPLGKPRPAQTHPIELGGWRAGITPMMTSLTREFVTRNTLRASKE